MIIKRVRELAKKEYDKSCYVKDAMAWHHWKRSFDFGYSHGYTDGIKAAIKSLENNNLKKSKDENNTCT